MRFGVTGKTGQILARGTALTILALVAAGCSSNVSRFQESLVGSTAPQPGVDTMQTASVNGGSGHPVPSASVGNGHQQMAAQPPAGGQQSYPSAQGQASAGQVSRGALPPTSGQAATADTMQSQQQTMAQASSGQSGGSRTVTVESGDTIYSLARRHGVDAAAIIQANGLADASNLRLGQSLTIPAGGQAPTVAQGEGILGTLPANNDRAPQQQPEQVAVLPQPSTTGNASGGAVISGDGSQNGSQSGRTYTVASGDTLNAIASKTGVSAQAIRQANGLDSGLIRIGQTLQIPEGGNQQVASVSPGTQSNVDPQPTGAVSTNGNGSQETSAPAPQPSQSESSVEEASRQEAAISPTSSGITQMRWPVRGRVTAGFGQTVNGRPNDGLDISVPEGTSIHAAEDGVVIFAGPGLRDFGNTVLVRHEGGLVTVYGHASEIKVQRGATVTRGQQIALSGMSGSAETPKVHFEVRKDSTPVDPTGYLE